MATPEQPFFDESKQTVVKPEDKPAKGTSKYEELQKFSKTVVLIIQTVNDTEYNAALSIVDPPTASFSVPVFFPSPNMVAGKIEGKNIVLIKADAGRAVGDFVENAKKKYVNARFVIGVGVCFAFKQEVDKDKCKFADVLVSKAIRDNSYMKFENDEIKDLGQKVNAVFMLRQIFCMESKKELEFKVSDSGRNATMHCGTFCCNTFLVKDERIRDAFHRLNNGDVGGEMEGGELLKLQLDGKIEGVIVIKGVADYADKYKAKQWQYTAARAALHFIKVQLRNSDELEDDSDSITPSADNATATSNSSGGARGTGATNKDTKKGSKPSVSELTIMKIISKLSSRWREVGSHFGLMDGEMDNIDQQAMKNNMTCCSKVFNHWINDGGNPPEYPLSWKGVYDVMCAIGRFKGAADDMKEELIKEGKWP